MLVQDFPVRFQLLVVECDGNCVMQLRSLQNNCSYSGVLVVQYCTSTITVRLDMRARSLTVLDDARGFELLGVGSGIAAHLVFFLDAGHDFRRFGWHR